MSSTFTPALPTCPSEDLTRAYDELFGVNVRGCIFGAKAALPALRETAGSMIFTASVAGLNLGGGGALYTASKHAVVGLDPATSDGTGAGHPGQRCRARRNHD